MMIMRIIFLFLATLCSAALMAQESLPTDTFKVAFRVNQQTRRYKVSFTEEGNSLVLHWNMLRNLHLQKGTFRFPHDTRKCAVRLSYMQPIDLEDRIMDSDETWLFISQDAYKALKTDGRCLFNNNTEYLLADTKESFNTIPLLHITDAEEGCEMWILDSPTLPLIIRMKNNPVEINWEIK